MSTKTTFKRVALVAVAALGLGVLSVAPSQASVIGLTVTSVNGTATTTSSDSTTAGSLRVTYTANASVDSVTITSYVSTLATGASAIAQSGIVTHLLDTSTSTVLPTFTNAAIGQTSAVRGDSVTVVANGSSNPTGQVSANFAYYLLSAPTTAGTYTITAIVTPFSNGVAGTAVLKTLDIVVAAAAKASSAYVHLIGGAQAADPVLGRADSVVAGSKVASTTEIGRIGVALLNASGASVTESYTATITGAGTLGVSGPLGRSLTMVNGTNVRIYPDGTGGVGTITISTAAGVLLATKTVSFYGDPAVVTLSSNSNAVVGTLAAPIKATVYDAAGYVVAGAQLYVTSSDTTVISQSYTKVATTAGVAAVTAADGTVSIPLTGVKLGSAKITVGLATSATDVTTTGYAVKSDALTVTVGGSTTEQAGVVVTTDKQVYTPGSYAYVTVKAVDKAGKTLSPLPSTAGTYTVFATGGISASLPIETVTGIISSTTFIPAAKAGTATSADPIVAQAGEFVYKIKLPSYNGDVTLSWTTAAASFFPGNTAAGGVAGSTVITLSDPGSQAAVDAATEATDAANAATDAALAAADAADAATAAAEDASAAVATLAKSVNTALGNLKKQITALTALVNKLLKK